MTRKRGTINGKDEMNNLLCIVMTMLLVALPASARTTQVLWLGVDQEGSPETIVIAGEAPEGREPGSAFLGLDIEDVTSDRVAALKLKEERGVEI